MRGNAQAINYAGQERYRSYQLAFLTNLYVQEEAVRPEIYETLLEKTKEFKAILHGLRDGDPTLGLLGVKDDPEKLHDLYDTFTRHIKDFDTIIEPLILGVIDNPSQEVVGLLIDNYNELVPRYVHDIDRTVKLLEVDSSRKLNRFRTVQFILLGLAGAVMGSSIFLVTTMVLHPLTRITNAVARLAGGDLGHRVKVTSGDELGELASSFNIMVMELAREINERKQAEEAARQMAYYDALTGLPNRMLFKDRLTVAIAHAHRSRERLAVMFLDLDRFKDVNDTLGHTVGDLLLKGVTDRLTRCVREEDTVARLGGDEFTMLLPGIAKMATVTRIAHRILDAVRQPLTLSDRELRITISIGITLYPDDGEDADILLRNADAAMYHAKEQGRDNYQHYTPALHSKTLERVELESALRSALEREELLVYYQPQVDINTRRIVSVEALVRWWHPDRGVISSKEFIPLAEDTGLIIPLGKWVLRTACAQNKTWQEAGLPPMRMAVNFSVQQIHQQNLVKVIKNVIKETGLDLHYLELEITESVLMKGTHATIAALKELNEMGVQITLDDFGAGYSSLGYLRRFSIAKLKIDQSFVQDIAIHPDADAIVVAIIALAKALHLRVIAEGVETEKQLEFLRSLRCDEIQGYLFSPPLPAEEATRLLAEERPLELSG